MLDLISEGFVIEESKIGAVISDSHPINVVKKISNTLRFSQNSAVSYY